MEWFQIIVSGLVSLITGVGGSILFFRPKLKEAKAGALKAQTDAQDYVYNSLIGRINQMEKMYNEQYETQNKVISDLRSEVLKLTKEKFASDQQIIRLQSENDTLRGRVDGLEKELQAYKVIKGSN